MDNSEILTATEASRAFSELLHRVCYGGQSFVIKKGNRLMARITPVEVAMQENESVPIAEAVSPDAPMPENVMLTGDEAEFYQAWMDQVRKVDA